MIAALTDIFSEPVAHVSHRIRAVWFDSCLRCPQSCQACLRRCVHAAGHGGAHSAGTAFCKHDPALQNIEMLCRKCVKSGTPNKVRWGIPTELSGQSGPIANVSSALIGLVLECATHGVLYRSRDSWFSDPVAAKVVEERVVHVFGDCVVRQVVGDERIHSRSVVDTLAPVGAALCQVSSSLSEAVGRYVPDRIQNSSSVSQISELVSSTVSATVSAISDHTRPQHWVHDSQVDSCCVCQQQLQRKLWSIHHCRRCGQGVCDGCSSKRRCVPSRGWVTPVRVCDGCDEALDRGIKEKLVLHDMEQYEVISYDHVQDCL